MIEIEIISDIAQRYALWPIVTAHWKKFGFEVKIWDILSWYMLNSDIAWPEKQISRSKFGPIFANFEMH